MNTSRRIAFLCPRRTATRVQSCNHQIAPLTIRCPRYNFHKHHLQERPLFYPRLFSTTRTCRKKKSKGGSATDDAPAKNDKSSKSAPVDDPLDFTQLEQDLAQTTEKLKSDLSKLRSGGRFNPQVLEILRVQPEKDNKTTYPLQDLAQMIPRGGREIQILVNDAAHVKPVSSAIQSSNLSLTPQPDPTGQNAQMLIVKIPPPTAESRKATLNEASKAGEVAQTAVRNARGIQQKKFRKMELAKSVRPDDLKKAHTKMEDVVKKAGEEVKKIVEGAKRALDS
ncbi:Ribosome recycling factor-like protein [Elsinoe fawcettii]|nr:Ribosome recycling factor-like protein [Elsinoe fawcettii]